MAESYLMKAVPENEWAKTVVDVTDEHVDYVRHHITHGLDGNGIYRMRRATFEALHVPCRRISTWRAKLPDG